MRLLYLFVQEWPSRGITPDKPVELNFDSEFHFYFSDDILTAIPGRKLPNGFFSVVDGRRAGGAFQSLVESVSVIVGDNGSGKTTIASLLGSLFERGRTYPHYVCIYAEDQDILIYSKLDCRLRVDVDRLRRHLIGYNVIDVDNDEMLPKAREGLKSDQGYMNPFDLIYYSPCVPSSDLWGTPSRARFHDVSTGHFLLTGELADKFPETPHVKIDRVQAYQIYQRRTNLTFAHEYVNKIDSDKLDDLILPMPRYVRVLVRDKILCGRPDMLTSDKGLAHALEKRGMNVQVVAINRLVEKTVCDSYCLRLLLEILLRASEGVDGYVSDRQYEDIGIASLLLLYERVTVYLDGDAEDLNWDDREGVETLGLHGRQLELLLKKLCPLARREKERRPLRQFYDPYVIDITDRKDLDDVLDAMSAAGRIGERYNDIIDFILADQSSGELAYWNMFSRIYDVIPLECRAGEVLKGSAFRHLLVFLDEAETTMHPEWQRAIVRNLIWFFERFTVGLKVHVVFSTHSPIILSDVPKGNVSYLFKTRMSPLGGALCDAATMRTNSEALHNTFGANIYDLYRLSFSLQEGTIGAFATQKISSWLPHATEPRTENEDDPVDLVGDDAIRRYLFLRRGKEAD